MIKHPITKIVRVLNYHFDDIHNFISYTDFLRYLNEKGFSILEKSKDDFFETFYNTEYKNENRATLVYFNYNLGTILHQFIVKNPE